MLSFIPRKKDKSNLGLECENYDFFFVNDQRLGDRL